VEDIVMENKVSAVLEPATQQAVETMIAEIDGKLPFLLNLKPEEIAGMLKFGDKSRAFVTKCLELATKHLDIMPRNFDVEEMRKDVALYDQLYAIQQPLRTLMEKIDGTLMEIGSEMYASALQVYSQAKGQKDFATFSTDTFDDLAKRFAKKTVASKEQTT
jgi:hypothetical protein